MTGTETLLRDLIALPSVNPAFLPPNDPCGGEERVASFLEKSALRVGLEAVRQPVAPGRHNLLVRMASRTVKPRHRILLTPHLDTVGGDPLSPSLFIPRRRHGRLYGRGACDTKGSIAAMFSALVKLARDGPIPQYTEILFVGLVDEESTQMGSRAFTRSRIRADLALVGEPTQLQVVTTHKGDLWLELETRGKSAHGARPELGRNAVHEMARIVDVLQTDYARMLSRRRHPLLGRATVNVGLIAGGRQPNIVPDHCRILVDRRTLPGEKDREVKRELMTFLEVRGFKPRLRDTKNVPSEPLATQPNLPLVKALMRLTGQRRQVGVDFFSDAGVLGAAGIPSVLFGPGNIAQAHTRDEWVSLEQLECARHCLVRFLENLP